MEDKIISYKGMDSKMQCRGMQYEVGKEFSVDGDIECCGNGLHACERPLDVFGYYAPGTGARYFRVEQSGEMARDASDSKVASRKMRVDAEIGIPGLVKAAHRVRKNAHNDGAHRPGTCYRRRQWRSYRRIPWRSYRRKQWRSYIARERVRWRKWHCVCAQ